MRNPSSRQRYVSRFVLVFAILIGFFALSATSVFAKRDKDNNPPGPAGGIGTNWENPKGPMGGPGASPNQKPWGFGGGDRDGNPPGMVGGPGTNLENPPGMMGGPGASPDKKPWSQGMNPPGAMGGPGAGPLWKDAPGIKDNPPGAMGGPGTDWGNLPGPIGGPGVGPVKDSEKYQEWVEKHKEKAAEWQEKREAFKEKMDLNDDGKIDPKEKALAHEKWLENHPDMKEKWQERKEKWHEEKKDWIADRPIPPGHMKDEFDTDQDGKLSKEERKNWKVASKEKHEAWKEAHPKAPWKDSDNNPPGPRGGIGTNWENRPGPQGGPGAGPDRGGPTIQKATEKAAGGGKKGPWTKSR